MKFLFVLLFLWVQLFFSRRKAGKFWVRPKTFRASTWGDTFFGPASSEAEEGTTDAETSRQDYNTQEKQTDK